MRAKASRMLHQLGRKFSGTSVANLSPIRYGYQFATNIISPPQNGGKCWIEYNGYEIIVRKNDHTGYLLYERGETEEHIRELIEDTVSPGDVVIDIGAHIGHHTLTLRKMVERSGTVYAIEPNPFNNELLRKTINKNDFDNVKLIEKGISDEAEKSILHMWESGNITEEKTDSASIKEKDGETKEVEIQTITFSKFLNENNISEVDFVKMDVEGHEENILHYENNTGVFNQIETLLIETHFSLIDNPSRIIKIISDNFENVYIIDNELNKKPLKEADYNKNHHILATN